MLLCFQNLGQHHKQQRRFRSLPDLVPCNEPQQRRAHDGQASYLRIVGADILGSIVRHEGDEPEAAEGAGDQAAGKQPDGQRYFNRDRDEADDRHRPADEQVVAEQLAKPADGEE